MQVEGYTTQTNTCACVESPNYFARLIVSNCEKKLYFMASILCLCCKCTTFLCACTPRNAMKHGIERKHL